MLNGALPTFCGGAGNVLAGTSCEGPGEFGADDGAGVGRTISMLEILHNGVRVQGEWGGSVKQLRSAEL
jgi:hypothetical protein